MSLEVAMASSSCSSAMEDLGSQDEKGKESLEGEGNGKSRKWSGEWKGFPRVYETQKRPKARNESLSIVPGAGIIVATCALACKRDGVL